MSSGDVTDEDRLAAALAGMLAAGLRYQPFAMAKQLIAAGWSCTDHDIPGSVEREQFLLGALLIAGKPLSVRGAIERVLGRHPGGRSWCLWRDSFLALIESGRVVEANSTAKRMRWAPASLGSDIQ